MNKCALCENDAVGTFGFRSESGSFIGATLCKEHKDTPTLRLVTEQEFQRALDAKLLESKNQ